MFPGFSRIAIFAVSLVGLGVTTLSARDVLDLGPRWFVRLRGSETRTAALWEWDAAQRKIAGEQVREREDTLEYFAAMHRAVRVLRASQPGLPEAYLVWWTFDYERADQVLRGPDPDSYPPASPETSPLTEADWRKREDSGIVWKPGDPWRDSVGVFLTNDQGKSLSDFNFLGCGVIADVA